MLSYWRELERRQFLPEEKIRESQIERLKKIIDYAYRNNSFYMKRFKEAGLSPEDINTHQDTLKIPLLNKEEIRQNSLGMISSGYRIEELQRCRTGGSTGKSLEIFLSEECSELRNACARRHDRWTGWEFGEPVGAVWGNPKTARTMREKIKEKLLIPQIYLDTMSINQESVVRFADEWRRVKPTLLFGHSHSLFILAQMVKGLDIKEIQPKAVLSTSMMLLQHEREEIESVFSVKVFNRYGCEEVGLIASECSAHEGMHLNSDNLYVEFIRDDGKPAEQGEEGRIIITDLLNYAMPFIRYQVEDYGVPSSRKCSCGRGLPLIEHVTGRVADFLKKPDGTRVAGVSLIENSLTRFAGINQMQIVQDSFDLLRIKLVPDKDYSRNTEIMLVDYFSSVFGKDIAVHIEHVKRIEPERSGKYRFSICRI